MVAVKNMYAHYVAIILGNDLTAGNLDIPIFKVYVFLGIVMMGHLTLSMVWRVATEK